MKKIPRLHPKQAFLSRLTRFLALIKLTKKVDKQFVDIRASTQAKNKSFNEKSQRSKLERKVKKLEENKNEQVEDNQSEIMDIEEASSGGWLQDNLRIIISIIIVVAIAGGVYSFSNRSEEKTTEKNESRIELVEEKDKKEDREEKKAVDKNNKKENVNISSVATSQETEKSFVETASRGDGMTHLARKALSNYLEKNPDSSLTAEHKIYIEDYLRKNVPRKKIGVGTSVEFSKDSIHKAVESSKKLNERQLKNLHRYAVQVSSLR